MIGNVRAAVYGLDQTLRQTSARLAELAAGPDARQSAGLGDERWPDQATPADTASAAAVNLDAARGPLAQAADALESAQEWAGQLRL